MITLDKLKFQFFIAGQEFAQTLDAEWNSFCQKCAIDIIEEELSPYDAEDSVIEIDNLQLNLKDISQDDLYEEFPIRLRNELRRVLALSPKFTTHTQHSVTNNSLLSTHSVQPITHWLSSPTLSRGKKIELLTMTLRENPNIVLKFIHNPTDISLLVTLSDLLESSSIKQIIYVESRSHTEVGIPDYWCSLYEWLLQYYPWEVWRCLATKRVSVGI